MNVIPTVVANVVGSNQNVMIYIVERVAVLFSSELSIDDMVAAGPYSILMRRSVEVQDARSCVGQGIPWWPPEAACAAEPGLVAGFALEIAGFVFQHVEEDLCMLVYLDIQLLSIAEDHQPHSTLIIHLLFKHDLVVPFQHLYEALCWSHGQTNVGVRVWTISSNHSTEVLRQEPDPSVYRP